MSKDEVAPRRVRIERNIYRRASGVYEVGFKDGGGKQRWRTVDGGITAARAVRDALLVRRGRGERVAPDTRLRFGDAAARWLAGPVVDLRVTTQDCYRNAVARHLLPRFGTRRMDSISPDDLAQLVRELRAEGLSESTIAIVIGVANRVYRYAARRLGWLGTNPVSLMLPSERPRPSQGARRRVFNAGELEQTIAAAQEPYRTLFTLAALTGARLSELLALKWMNMRIDDADDAEIEFACQVDRRGNLRPTKTDDSARTVPIPRELARILANHRGRSCFASERDFVFSTRTGRPLGQRNVLRALRRAQERAVDEAGSPTFPVLHERDTHGRPMPVAHGTLPTFHSFRHTVASRALLAGESVDEVAFLLGHRDANVTRTVYVRELADARRRRMRRSRMAMEFAELLRAPSRGEHPGESLDETRDAVTDGSTPEGSVAAS
jgi:integrase